MLHNNVVLKIFCFIYLLTSLGKTNVTLSKTDDCERVLETFALATSNFTFCAILYARPIKLCQLCVEKYQNVESVHNDILTLEDEDGDPCKAKLLNLDRLQVVDGGFQYVDGLWKRAQCSKCFECDRTGSPTKQLNQNTIEMLRLSNDTQACIENHRNDLALPFEDPKVCTVCKSGYLALNSRYEFLKVQQQGFCMDIEDIMNSTRAQWSTELGCCLDRKKPEWFFLVSSLVVTCMPLVLYLAAFLFVSLKEQTLMQQRRLKQANTVSSASTSTTNSG